MQRWFFWILIAGMAFGASFSIAQVPVGEILSVDGRRLTLSFFPEDDHYELTPFNVPRYEILKQEAGKVRLLIRGITVAMEAPQPMEIPVGPLTSLEIASSPRGLLLTATSDREIIVEHTRRAIRLLFGSALGESPPATAPAEVPPMASAGLSPGDRVIILVFWETGPMRQDEVVVGDDGTIAYQELGKVAVRGMSLPQLRETLQRRLSRYLRHFSVQVYGRQAPMPRVTVVGALRDASAAGEYRWYPRMHLTALLEQAGGWSDEADIQRVALYRPTDGEYERFIYNLDDATRRGEAIPLRPEDVVFLPRREVRAEIGVYGWVKRPGAQPLRSGMTLSDALKAAGGPTIQGRTDLTITLLRQDGEEIHVAYDQLRGRYDLPLKHGDVVYLHIQVSQGDRK